MGRKTKMQINNQYLYCIESANTEVIKEGEVIMFIKEADNFVFYQRPIAMGIYHYMTSEEWNLYEFAPFPQSELSSIADEQTKYERELMEENNRNEIEKLGFVKRENLEDLIISIVMPLLVEMGFKNIAENKEPKRRGRKPKQK